jgi:hypothetical protein
MCAGSHAPWLDIVRDYVVAACMANSWIDFLHVDRLLDQGQCLIVENNRVQFDAID